MSGLSLGLFAETGRQDCCNVISASEFDLALGSIDAVMAAFERDHFPGGDDSDEAADAGMAWIAQLDTEEYEGLDPVECYRAWRGGWLATAREIVEGWLAERSAS